MFSGFSWQYDYLHIESSEESSYFQVRLQGRICLPPSTPTPFNHLFRQAAVVSLLRLRITLKASNGILTVSSIGYRR